MVQSVRGSAPHYTALVRIVREDRTQDAARIFDAHHSHVIWYVCHGFDQHPPLVHLLGHSLIVLSSAFPPCSVRRSPELCPHCGSAVGSGARLRAAGVCESPSAQSGPVQCPRSKFRPSPCDVTDRAVQCFGNGDGIFLWLLTSRKLLSTIAVHWCQMAFGKPAFSDCKENFTSSTTER